MERTEGKVGMTVIFGRRGGEKTRGRIVRVNAKNFKVETLEDRGKNSPLGSRWNVPPSLCEQEGIATETMPAGSARTDDDLMAEIFSTYMALEPERLSCDGERSRSQMAAVKASLERRLSLCFVNLGRKVTEDEALAWFDAGYGLSKGDYGLLHAIVEANARPGECDDSDC